MPGYWRDEEQSQLALRDGWLYTGDLGWLDDEGYLYFVDRKKDVIRRRGENISSQEVENVVGSQVPGDVDRQALLGVFINDGMTGTAFTISFWIPALNNPPVRFTMKFYSVVKLL